MPFCNLFIGRPSYFSVIYKVYIVAAGNGSGNGNDSMGVGREWEQESYSHTPLVQDRR